VAPDLVEALGVPARRRAGGPRGREIGGVLTAVYAGSDSRAAQKAIAPFERIGSLRQGGPVQIIPYAALVPESHLHPNVGQQAALTRNGMVDVLDDTVEALIRNAAADREVIIQLRSLGGAIGDVDARATAFANRHQSAMVIGTAFATRGRAELNRRWRPLVPHFTGAYGNFESSPTPASLALAFPATTQARLRDVKAKYDPDVMLRPL
jgi:hypothetical protein